MMDQAKPRWAVVSRVLREPLLHFLLIGLALFTYYGRAAPEGGDERRIVVSQAHVDELGRRFQATWNRPATAKELAGLVDSYVSDEILYREGRTLGLDRDDQVIKRRVRQKVEVLAEEDGERRTPTDAELTAYLVAHPEKFAPPALVSFEQLYFDSTKAGVESRVRAAGVRLAAGDQPASLGEPTMLPYRVDRADLDTVEHDFGSDFASTLTTVPRGQWVGPVRSGLGVHLVRVTTSTPSVRPALDDVRQQVQREWEYDRRKRAFAASYERMRARYDVAIEARLAHAQ
ncbi:MAG TPA: peptidylprolyl isomerase [Steroidobacteraceae bacterium]